MFIAASTIFAVFLVLWIGVRKIPWLGPALADGARAIVGPSPVAWAEDIAYALEDRVNRWRFDGDSPHTYWDVPVHDNSSTTNEEIRAETIAEGVATSADFRPEPINAPFPIVAAPSDGTWIAVRGRAVVNGSPSMYKTMLHPDAERRFAVLAVVAMDVARVRIHAAFGTVEPRGDGIPARMRQGSVPVEHQPSLIAAFNGGFQTIHGNYAMMVHDNAVGEAQPDSCTIALYHDKSVRVRSWYAVKNDVPLMEAYRQTPRCLVENGQRHPELENKYNTSWGAVVDKGTVIRRSALGLSENGRILFFGMGDSLTARSLADGMKAAGAHYAAQLDINQVYPRFVFFDERKEGKIYASEPLCPGFNFGPNDYVHSPMARDFFYITTPDTD